MTEQLHARLEQKTVTDQGSGEISGLAAVYGNIDLQDDMFEQGALAKTAADWSRSKSRVPLIDWHGDSLSRLIGSVVELKSIAQGLWFRAQFASSEAGQRARQLAKDGHLSGVSVGWLPVRQSSKWIGDRMVRVISEARLHEISLTPIPANPEAQLASVKSLGTAAAGLDGDLAELVALEAWAREATGEQARLQLADLASAPAATWQVVADVKSRSETERMEADLMAWAYSPEVTAAIRHDPAREAAEAQQRRRDRDNAYTFGLRESMAREAVMPSPCGGRCQWCRAGAPSACSYR